MATLAETSPIYTPCIQGMPPWAVTTPSPMPFNRWPQPEAKDSAPIGSGPEASASASLVPRDLLWEVCSPFISEMLEALQRVVDEQFEQVMSQASSGLASSSQQQQQQAPVREPFNGLFVNPRASPPVGNHQASNPFGSLFKGTPTMPHRMSQLSTEPIKEVGDHDAFSTASSACPTPQSASRAVRSSPHIPQRVVYSPQVGHMTMENVDEHSQTSGLTSEAGTPALSPRISPAGGAGTIGDNLIASSGNLAASSLGVGPGPPLEAAADAYAALSASDAQLLQAYMQPNSTPNDVMYLSWPQQHFTDRWDDLSDLNEQPAGALVNASAPVAEAGDADEADDDAADDPDGSGEKKPKLMICRHWTTKGWCRMEGNCKFQHPDQLRGPTIISTSRPSRRGGGTSDSGAVAAQTSQAGASTVSATTLAAMEAAGTSPGKRASRRSGRNRHFAQPVAVGPIPAKPGGFGGGPM